MQLLMIGDWLIGNSVNWGFGYLGIWLFGDLVIRVTKLEYSNNRIPKSTYHQIHESPNPQINKSPNPQFTN